MSDAALKEELAHLGIEWSILEHEAVFTVEESLAIHDALPGAHTKNLFLKDSGGQLWLVTVEHSKRVDLKALASVIGAKKLSFGKAEDMEAQLGVTPGSVTPLGARSDILNEVNVVLDEDLAGANMVYVHPLRNTATVGLSGANLLRVLDYYKHKPAVVTIPERPPVDQA